VALDLYWQVETAIPDDLVLFVQARDRVNKLWGLYEGPAVGMQYPTSRWVVGDILRSQVSFLLAPDAPGGEYDLYVGWLRGRKMERLAVARGGNEVAVAHVVAVSRQHVMALPQPSKPMDVRLGESVQLLGIDAEREVVQPGANANLTLYWRCLARMETAYSVFVHVVDGRGNIQAQIDSEPVEGKIPTTSWLPGEVVADRLQIRIPLGLPAGSYAVIGGMYDRVTGKRLRAQNAAGGSGGDAIELGQIVVAGP
jgi:hypothetical protein